MCLGGWVLYGDVFVVGFCVGWVLCVWGGFWVDFGFLGLILVFITCMLLVFWFVGWVSCCGFWGGLFVVFLWMFWVVCFEFVVLVGFFGVCVLLGLI